MYFEVKISILESSHRRFLELFFFLGEAITTSAILYVLRRVRACHLWSVGTLETNKQFIKFLQWEESKGKLHSEDVTCAFSPSAVSG